MEKIGLGIANIRGKRYDGNNSMSNNLHCLNLAKNCSIPVIKNILDKLIAVCLFFRDTSLLQETAAACKQGTSIGKVILDLCKT